MIALPLSLLIAAAAPGQGDHIDCANAMAQSEMNLCAIRDFERADAELNALWPGLIAHARENDRSPDAGRLPGDDRTEEETLRRAQRGWIAYRDGYCTLEGFSSRGGSLETLIFEGCRARMTRARIAELSPSPAHEQENR